MRQDFIDHLLILDTAVRRIGDDLDMTSTIFTALDIDVA